MGILIFLCWDISMAGMTRAEIALVYKRGIGFKESRERPCCYSGVYEPDRFSVGRGCHPGRFNIEKDKLTLLEALSMAGDLTVYGKRENVLVQREENGKTCTGQPEFGI